MKTNLQSILQIISEYYGVSENLIKSKSRKDEVVKARHAYFYIAYKTSGKGLAEIGKLVNRDHTTVIHGIRKIEGEIDIYQDTFLEFKELKAKCDNKTSVAIEDVDLLQMSINYTNSFIKS